MDSKIRLLFFFLIFLCSGNNTYAVPAYPNKVMVKTAEGKAVAIYMRGDEYQKYAVTEEGYTLLGDSEGWWYAYISDTGIVERSVYGLSAVEDETPELKNFKFNCPKGLVPKKAIPIQSNRTIDNNRVNSNVSVVGERHALVILMQFKDQPFSTTKEDFETLFNTIEYKVDGATGSVRDYYHFASQGQLDYISDIYGPYTSINPMKYYGANVINGGNDRNPLELCVEAIKSLPDNIDFSLYDNDKDGLVDNVHIIYAGYGEESGASTDAIWAHEYPHRISLRNEVGYSFAGYSCSPELRGNWGSNITNIGVICHELGHALGAMDYYDTNYGTGGEYEGTGKWDVMASGSWNNDGRTPPNFNPYVRSIVFGWNTQVVLDQKQNVSMPRMETDNPQQTVIYKLETGSRDDYFLLENRQKYYFDSALPGEGLMIYHVHPNIDRYNTTNTINATNPQGFYPVCASYSEPSKKKYGNINSAGCPFPGSMNVRSFSSTTSPSAVAWNGSAAKVPISYITLNSSDGSISFTTGDDIIVEPDIPDQPVAMDIVHEESFESSVTERMSINSIFGKEIWRTYSKGDFIMGADYIPEATNGNNILMMYSIKGSAMNESEAISDEIEIVPGVNYTISFDICCIANSSAVAPTFNLYVEDEYGEYNIYSLSKETSGWKKVELPLIFAGENFKYKLYGRIYSGGIFIDNLRLYKEEEATQIKHVPNSQNQIDGIFNINGMSIKSAPKPHGINIIRYKNGSTYKVLSK